MRHATSFLRRLLPIAGALAVVSVAWATVTHRTPANTLLMRASAATPAAPAPSVVVLRPAVARPSPAPSSVVSRPTPRAETAPARAGLRAFLDPETGTIGGPPPSVPGAAQSTAPPVPAAPAPIAGLATDGSPMLDLQGGLQEYAVLRITADGRRVMRCVPDPKAPLEAEHSPAASPVEE